MENNVKTELLAACNKALECIARLTPFTYEGMNPDLEKAANRVADYADAVRELLQKAIDRAESKTT